MAVVEAQGLTAVVTCEAIVAHAPAIHTPAVLLAAGHRADLLAAVSPCVTFETHADPFQALALVTTVTGAGQLAAVIPREALITDALSSEALASQVTVAWTFRLRAVGAFPARFTNTATSFCAKVATATAEGPGVQATCNGKNKGSQLRTSRPASWFYLQKLDPVSQSKDVLSGLI